MQADLDLCCPHISEDMFSQGMAHILSGRSTVDSTIHAIINLEKFRNTKLVQFAGVSDFLLQVYYMCLGKDKKNLL